MARMEMDCNLKKLANFFTFSPCVLEKSLKTDFGLYLVLQVITRNFGLHVLRVILCASKDSHSMLSIVLMKIQLLYKVQIVDGLLL